MMKEFFESLHELPWLADVHALIGYGPSLDDKILNKNRLI
jgi:hypothetical protein